MSETVPSKVLKLPPNPHSERPLGPFLLSVFGLLCLAGALASALVAPALGGGLLQVGFGALVLGCLGTLVYLARRACWELRRIHTLLEEQTEQLCGGPEKQHP